MRKFVMFLHVSSIILTDMFIVSTFWVCRHKELKLGGSLPWAVEGGGHICLTLTTSLWVLSEMPRDDC